MIVKPAISWIASDTDTVFVNDTNVVLTTMDENVAIYATPSPSLATVQTALDNLVNAMSVAATGSQADTNAKNNARAVVMGLLRQLASYVQVACQGDMEKLLLSGFPVQKPNRAPIGPLPAPQNALLDHGSNTGCLNASVNPVFGAASYNWKLTASAPGAAPILGQSTGSNFTFTGLTPGVNYTVTANVLGAAGTSDWSNPASLFCD
jgi:hypothetical protein